MLRDPNVIVIHAEREMAAARGPQIPGARFLPMRAFVNERDGLTNELPPVAVLDSVLESIGVSTGSRIVVYGDPLAAARLFFTLDYLGLENQVSLLDGGLVAWRAANLPIAEHRGLVAAGTLTPRVRPELLIGADELLAALRAPDLALLDARPPAEYAGTEPGEAITRGGHIPGATNYFWRQALTGAEQAYLKDPAELRKALTDAGLLPGKRVVTYCRTGVQASYLYFIARYLGYAPRMYDGSYAEWSRRAELPVQR